MLATKGVNNGPSHGLVQFVVPIGEDTDRHEYVIRDGEDTHQLMAGVVTRRRSGHM
jgi:hypothetical protein